MWVQASSSGSDEAIQDRSEDAVKVPPDAVWQAHNNGGTANYSKKRCSFFAFTLGLSSVQDALLYARAQALRVALGGGYA